MRLSRPTTIILLLIIFVAGCVEKKPERLTRRESPVSARLTAMIADLQAAGTLTEEQLAEMDKRHRRTVYQFIAKALIREPEDLYRAALLLKGVNGTPNPDIWLQSHLLAAEAASKGWPDARYLAATTLDRYQVLVGEPQCYGTQHYINEEGRRILYPYDPTTSDSDRAAWDVPPLDSLKAHIQALDTL